MPTEGGVPADLANIFCIPTHVGSGTWAMKTPTGPSSDRDAEGENGERDDNHNDNVEEVLSLSHVAPHLPRPADATPPSSANRPYPQSASVQWARRISSPPSSSSSSRAAGAFCGTVNSTAFFATPRRAIPGAGRPNFYSVDANGYPRCETCSRTFVKARYSDFKRHVLSHYPDEASKLRGPVVCCGVPVALRSEYSIPENARVGYFDGHAMVGGCWKKFSRKDALGRHLRNKNRRCVGDLKGSWHLLKKGKSSRCLSKKGKGRE
ncbi:hypothetical protein BDW22DRAFT_1364620 [Trametopsis cervina]|nr:hypothetical protein BDW22DRAFT_1364620 [Trametopsis cervina]